MLCRVVVTASGKWKDEVIVYFAVVRCDCHVSTLFSARIYVLKNVFVTR